MSSKMTLISANQTVLLSAATGCTNLAAMIALSAWLTKMLCAFCTGQKMLLPVLNSGCTAVVSIVLQCKGIVLVRRILQCQLLGWVLGD